MRTRAFSIVVCLLGCTPTDTTTAQGSPTSPERSPAHEVADAAPPARLSVLALALGGHTSYALMSDGSVRAWGEGMQGELGTTARSEAVTPVEVPGVSDAIAIAANGVNGQGTACAIRREGEVVCWGDDFSLPRDGDRMRVLPPTTIDALAGARLLAIGTMMGCVVMSDGELRCWDSDHHAPARLPAPPDIVALRSVYGHACALTRAKTLACWGDNDDAQSSWLSDAREIAAPLELPLADVSDVLVGIHDTCALLADHSLRCWGRTHDHAVPLATDAKLTALGNNSRARHRCMLDADRHVYCLGDNESGQLGAQPSASATPIEVVGLDDVKEVATGEVHTCALKHDGTVWCWGENRFGQLGDGTLIDRSTPGLVSQLNEGELPEPPPLTAPPPDVAQDFSQLPEGCTQGLLALHDDSTPTSFATKAAFARYREDRKIAEIWLRDYPDAKPFEIDPRADHRMLRVTLERREVSRTRDKRVVLVPGTYREGRQRHGPGIEPMFEASLATSRSYHPPYDSVEYGPQPDHRIDITHLGDDWICGTFDLKGERSSLSGSFAAQVVE